MKIRLIAAALTAAFFLLPFFGLTVYATEIEDLETPVAAEDAPETEIPIAGIDADIMTEYGDSPVTDFPKNPPLPLPPSGTATVVDHATDLDGRLFYTIMTPDEHVFYLVIDKQRNSENVYFLNAVTVADLLPLAELPAPHPGGSASTPTAMTGGTEQQPENPDAPDDEQAQGGSMGIYIFIIVLAALGGGAGWYFKIYRPKQQNAASGEEYDPAMDDADIGYADDWGEDSDEADDSPPWNDDESEDGE